ncbi:MAG: sigma-54-dependent Fis family transcriptional regulator [Planctomycetia bacterium]|nr:MAG: sigma-54-dependent Fis family transcriptional regulator [Planctomycetia bacterium]
MQVSPEAARARVLVVDDDPAVLRSLGELLRLDGHEVVTAPSAPAALRALVDAQERGGFDLLITDLTMPDGDGLDLLGVARERWGDMLTVMLTGFGTIESAVEAMKRGAFEFLTKPVEDERLRAIVQRAAAQQSATRATRALRSDASVRTRFENVFGRTYQMQRVFDLAEAVADSRTTILMHGETGTGKSMIARAIHQRSPRRDKPFIEVACGAIPETLLESELFGHVKGAFTGAVSDKDGKFRAAEAGTIFLDEIGTASPALQVKLLRVLQEKRFEPVGTNRTLAADVRVILAANVDLEKEVAAGRFRKDLYYRINIVTIELPPLRSRLGDIPLLAEHFLAKYRRETGKHVLGFTRDAIEAMLRYAWPGNVRELENCVERAVVLMRGDFIGRQDLPPQIVAAASGELPALSVGGFSRQSLRKALEEPEKQILRAALEANNWNRQLTAEMLEINRTTLYKKMRQHGLMPRR